MRPDTEAKALECAEKFLTGDYTVRSLAEKLHISKSTVMKYLKDCQELDVELYSKVRERLDYNKSVRHIRGGDSTRKRYTLIKGGEV